MLISLLKFFTSQLITVLRLLYVQWTYYYSRFSIAKIMWSSRSSSGKTHNATQRSPRHTERGYCTVQYCRSLPLRVQIVSVQYTVQVELVYFYARFNGLWMILPSRWRARRSSESFCRMSFDIQISMWVSLLLAAQHDGLRSIRMLCSVTNCRWPQPPQWVRVQPERVLRV